MRLYSNCYKFQQRNNSLIFVDYLKFSQELKHITEKVD
jgi:hypothetical protein